MSEEHGNDEVTPQMLINDKSKIVYRKVYEHYVSWMKKKSVNSYSEANVLAFFKELSSRIQPQTLWSKYSMLNTMLKLEQNVDLEKYNNLRKYLKEMNTGHKPKKMKALTPEHIDKFIAEAPDEKYLDIKVALILGITGACRRNELYRLTVNDIIDTGSHLIVTIPETESITSRTFTIVDPYRQIVLKYSKKRPVNASSDNFFLNYSHGSCTLQKTGVNKIGTFPKKIAAWLKLPNPESYTAHTFRRTSKLHVNSGASITILKRRGEWKSSNAAERNILQESQPEDDMPLQTRVIERNQNLEYRKRKLDQERSSSRRPKISTPSSEFPIYLDFDTTSPKSSELSVTQTQEPMAGCSTDKSVMLLVLQNQADVETTGEQKQDIQFVSVKEEPIDEFMPDHLSLSEDVADNVSRTIVDEAEVHQQEVKSQKKSGTELTDVSILRKMKNVEVLSLSVNNISSLADFQNCIDLKDLFVRRNNIRDLNEVCYLQGLPNLRNLWLGENPCAEVEGYRLAVIKALPHLEKLDDVIVSPEEVQTAMLRGRTLIHPLNLIKQESPSPQSGRGSPEVMVKYDEDQDVDQRQNYSSSDDQRSYDEASIVDDYQETDKRNANYNKSPVQQYPPNNRYSYEQNGRNRNTDNNTRNISYPENSTPTKILESQQNTNPVSPRGQYAPAEYIDERRIEYEEPQRPPSAQSRRGGMNQSIEREDLNHTPVWMRREKDKRRSQFQYQRRPVTRNSNILSAVLCLVKELDYPSLEVVEMAVRSRIDELEE